MGLTVADVVELPKKKEVEEDCDYQSWGNMGDAHSYGFDQGYNQCLSEISSLPLSPEKVAEIVSKEWEISSLPLSPEKVVGMVEINEQEIWKVLQGVHGCKKSGEDCNFYRCNNIGECQLLVERLITNKSKILNLRKEKQ